MNYIVKINFKKKKKKSRKKEIIQILKDNKIAKIALI